jgi:DNA mismatch repair protein MutL
LAVIQLDVDPQLVDVNVHPRKTEVRFFQERSIYGAVGQAVEQALRAFNQMTLSKAEAWPFAGVSVSEPPTAPLVRDERSEYRIDHWRAVAQVHNTYILAQTNGGMVIVDQHAAQEQIFYELLTTAAGGRRVEAGVQLQLTPREADLLNRRLHDYRTLGIDLEPFGESTFRVNALPAFVSIEPRELVAVLVQEQARHPTVHSDALRDKLAAKTACVSAVKAGDALSNNDQQALLDALAQIYAPATCPHGRPVFVMLSLEELERRFLRR